MLKDITLGQFFPGTTVIHKLDPRTKLIWVVMYIVALFLAKWFVSYALVMLTLAAIIAASKSARNHTELFHVTTMFPTWLSALTS